MNVLLLLVILFFIKIEAVERSNRLSAAGDSGGSSISLSSSRGIININNKPTIAACNCYSLYYTGLNYNYS